MPEQLRKDKDPAAVLKYKWDLGDWLESGETITAATVTVVGVALAADAPAPVIVAGSRAGVTPTAPRTSVPNGAVEAWISGGTKNAINTATLEWTTSAGQRDRRTIVFTIVDH